MFNAFFPQPQIFVELDWILNIKQDVNTDGESDFFLIVVKVTFSWVQWLSHVWLFAAPWTAACQASLCITNFQSLISLLSIKLVMPSNHLILGHIKYTISAIFKLYSSVALSTFMLLCNSHHHPCPEFFTFLNWNSVPIALQTSLPSTSPWHLLSVPSDWIWLF